MRPGCKMGLNVVPFSEEAPAEWAFERERLAGFCTAGMHGR